MLAFYHVALFIHVTGAITLFIAGSFELVSMIRLRRAETLGQAQEAGRIALVHVKLILPAVLTVFLAGLYMAIAAWNFATVWIDVALAIFLAHSVVAQAVNAPRAKAIFALLMSAPEGALAPELRRRLGDPILHASVEIMFAQTVGIVFLMTVKPGLIVALISVIVATLTGLIPTLLRRGQAMATTAERVTREESSVLSAASK